MTLTLELPPEVEAQLLERAEAQGENLQAVALSILMDGVSGNVSPPGPLTPRTERQQAVLRACGMLKSDGHAVDQFLQERHEEAEQEFQKDRARHQNDAPGSPVLQG